MTQYQNILICENTPSGTDKRLLENLIQRHALLPTTSYYIETRFPGSINDVTGFLKNTLVNQTYIVSKEAKNVLVIVDSDENPKQRFAKLKACFDSNVFQVQASLGASLPKSTNKINVGIFLFPDCRNPGSLETLCLKTLKHLHLDSKLHCVGQYMGCVSNLDSEMTENNSTKSKIRIFTATPDPDRYVDSILKLVDFDSTEFNLLKDFIKQAK